MTNPVQCKSAIADIERRLECLPASDNKVIKLVQFNHQSPGLMALRHTIAEAIIRVIEEKHVIRPKS